MTTQVNYDTTFIQLTVTFRSKSAHLGVYRKSITFFCFVVQKYFFFQSIFILFVMFRPGLKM